MERTFEVGRVSETVVDAISAAARVDPTTMPPLYETVDPDALDALFRTDAPGVSISFDYDGFTVEVEGAGTVRVVARR